MYEKQCPCGFHEVIDTQLCCDSSNGTNNDIGHCFDKYWSAMLKLQFESVVKLA